MTSQTPAVSVIIPCYNAAGYLRETVASVLAQTVPVLEVIIVDDGSTDQSRAIAEEFPPPVRVVVQHNQGESVARNAGIENARGEWIAFLDADDLWDPGKIEAQLQLIRQRPEIDCIHTGYRTFGSLNEIIVHDDYVDPALYTVERLLLNSTIHVSTVMVRKNLGVRFPVWTKHGEDMIYFAELAIDGRFAYVPECLGGYRVHQKMQTRSAGYHRSHLQSRLQWVDRAADQLGHKRAAGLKRQIREQLVAWTQHALWHREWDRYWDLRRFAETLDWEGAAPRVLRKRPWNPAVYRIGDWLARRTFLRKPASAAK